MKKLEKDFKLHLEEILSKKDREFQNYVNQEIDYLS